MKLDPSSTSQITVNGKDMPPFTAINQQHQPGATTSAAVQTTKYAFAESDEQKFATYEATEKEHLEELDAPSGKNAEESDGQDQVEGEQQNNKDDSDGIEPELEGMKNSSTDPESVADEDGITEAEQSDSEVVSDIQPKSAPKAKAKPKQRGKRTMVEIKAAAKERKRIVDEEKAAKKAEREKAKEERANEDKAREAKLKKEKASMEKAKIAPRKRKVASEKLDSIAPKKPRQSKSSKLTLAKISIPSTSITRNQTPAEDTETIAAKAAETKALIKMKSARPYSYEEMDKVFGFLTNLSPPKWTSITDEHTLEMPHRNGEGLRKEVKRVVDEVLKKYYKEKDVGEDEIAEKEKEERDEERDIEMDGMEMLNHGADAGEVLA